MPHHETLRNSGGNGRNLRPPPCLRCRECARVPRHPPFSREDRCYAASNELVLVRQQQQGGGSSFMQWWPQLACWVVVLEQLLFLSLVPATVIASAVIVATEWTAVVVAFVFFARNDQRDTTEHESRRRTRRTRRQGRVGAKPRSGSRGVSSADARRHRVRGESFPSGAGAGGRDVHDPGPGVGCVGQRAFPAPGNVRTADHLRPATEYVSVRISRVHTSSHVVSKSPGCCCAA